MDIEERIKSENLPAFIDYILNDGADKSADIREAIATLLAELFVRKLLNSELFKEG